MLADQLDYATARGGGVVRDKPNWRSWVVSLGAPVFKVGHAVLEAAIGRADICNVAGLKFKDSAQGTVPHAGPARRSFTRNLAGLGRAMRSSTNAPGSRSCIPAVSSRSCRVLRKPSREPWFR
jgi:hypothetical protein